MAVNLSGLKCSVVWIITSQQRWWKGCLVYFFAFCKPKYEKLITETLYDIFPLPPDIKRHFADGEWTVSLKAHKYHNIAIDEAQECVVNRRLKAMTTRPSHFRTVQLADFSAYMDAVLLNFENHAFKYHKFHETTDRVKPTLRANKVLDLIRGKNLFVFAERPLQNIFSVRPKQLSVNVITDLLSICETGKARFDQYIRQYFLQVESKEKRDKRKLNTFTEKTSTRRKQKSKLDQRTPLLKLAHKELASHNVGFVQTSPFPLALTDEKGTFRQAKSKYIFLMMPF